MEAIRGAASQTGVAAHSEVFKATAKLHEDRATRWLVAAVLAAVATAVMAIVVVLRWETTGDISEASVLQVVLAKGVLLTVGFYFTLTCFRMQRANSHLAVVNRHRETSLNTFQAFVEGTADASTKDKILLEAAHAVFGQTATGMIDGKDSSGVIEVLEGATGGLIRRGQ